MTQKTIYLVDASIYVFRAWHSMPDHFTDSEGWPTNAVQGFLRFLLDLLEQAEPEHIVVAFDQSLGNAPRKQVTPKVEFSNTLSLGDSHEKVTFHRQSDPRIH